MEERDYPGYTNIAFQRARTHVFYSFRLDLASMSRFAATMDNFLLQEAERRRYEETLQVGTGSQLVAELTGSFVDTLLSSMIVALYGLFESFLFDVCKIVYDKKLCPNDPGVAFSERRQVPTLLLGYSSDLEGDFTMAALKSSKRGFCGSPFLLKKDLRSTKRRWAPYA